MRVFVLLWHSCIPVDKSIGYLNLNFFSVFTIQLAFC
jgi:hypothetical protein